MTGSLRSRRFWLALVALGAAGWAPALAKDWYFSNCATGGSGTLASPYCLDPAGTGKNVSFSFLADGVAPELAAGDNVYLCAGACDGSGTAVYPVENTGTAGICGNYFFDPQVSGTATSPITIRNYPGETVTLRGDKNGNGVADPGDADHLVTNSGGRGYYKFMGLGFNRATQQIFCGRGSGFPNWTFDSLDVSESDYHTWGVTAGIGTIPYTSGVPTCGSGSQGAYCFMLTGHTGTATFTNNKIHTCCNSAVRFVQSPSAGSVTFDNNEFYDATTSVEFWYTGTGVTLTNNYIHDVHLGIQAEDRIHNVLIEGNRIACLGQYAPSPDGRCLQAIEIDNGDNNDTTDTFNGKFNETHDVTVRRNKIWATNVGSPLTHSGKFNGGIAWTADCLDAKGCTAINGLIENNMLWSVRTLFNGHYMTRGALDVSANKAITVQNNSIYDTVYGMQLDATVPGVNHIVRNNLVSKCTDECISVFPTGGTGSGITFNNLYNAGTAPALAFCSDATCTTYSSSYTNSTLASGFGQSNRSAASILTNVSGAVGTWDLHLASTDSSCKDRGTTGASQDIDRDTRATPVDIGADEYQALVSGPPTATLNIAAAPVRPTDGAWLLRVSTWSITLIASKSLASLPPALTFKDSSGANVLVTLSGTLPGTTFTGTMVVGSATPEGAGSFTLPTGALVDTSGNTGNTITVGSQAVVDKTPPSIPTHLVFQ